MQAFELSDRICFTLQIPNLGRLTPTVVDRALNERIAELRSECDDLERDIDMLADRRARKNVIDGFWDFEDNDFDFDEFERSSDPPPTHRRSGGKRKGRKRARR